MDALLARRLRQILMIKRKPRRPLVKLPLRRIFRLN